MDLLKELSKKFFMTQEEVLQLPEFSSKMLIIIRKSKNSIWLLKVCFQDKLFSVEKRLLSKLVIFYQLDKFLKELLFPMLNKEKVIMENLLELQVHLLLLLLILKMDLKLELNFQVELEKLLTQNQEE